MTIRFTPFDAAFVARVRAGGPDAYGQPAERHVSDGAGNPCRCCLGYVPEGAGMLVLAASPFPDRQPYAETGPIFLCADDCAPWDGEGPPPALTSAQYLLKGYTSDNRILYGTGRIVPRAGVEDYAAALLSDARLAYVDLRSAANNCFLTRITRADRRP